MANERLSRIQRWVLVFTYIWHKHALCHKTMRQRLYFLRRQEIYKEFYQQDRDVKPIEDKVRVVVTRSLKNLEEKNYIDIEDAGRKLFLTTKGVKKAKMLVKIGMVIVVDKT